MSREGQSRRGNARFGRTQEEHRIFGWVQVNNLDNGIMLDAFEWAEANRHAQVEAF